jgi:hypothetical protein
MVELPDYEMITRGARPYPSYLLPAGGTALSLFSAAFYGWNDVIHLARAEMEITCVDVDQDKLWEMASAYPNVMTFYVKDAWEFAEQARAEGTLWDVVTVDPFRGDAGARAWESVDLWASLARDLVTLMVESETEIDTPVGWQASRFPRGENVEWLVLQRD